MQSKKKKKNKLVDTLIVLLVSIVLAYAAAGALRALFLKQNLTKTEMDFQGTIQYLINGDLQVQGLTIAVFIGAFVLLVKGTGNKNKGYEDASDHGAHGNAVFSDLPTLREQKYVADKKDSNFSSKNYIKTLEASEGIILGREGKELLIIPPDSALDNRNVCVVGSSGSAKGQSFVIPNIINHKNDTIIVTDPKGELFNLTADIKRDQGYKVFQIDFLNLKGDRYNPLDYVNNDIQATKIAQTISLNSGKDVKQDFFFNTAKDLLTGLIIYAKSIKPNANISKDVKGLFNEVSSDERFLKDLCIEIGDEHPAYQYLKDASVSTGNTRTSILSSFAQQTSVFSLSDVQKLTATSDFNFHEFQEQKSILYVKVPVKDNPVPALTATFFDQLISVLYQIGDENGSVLKIPTVFLLDEFANLGKLNGYDNTLSTCRGYQLSMMTIIQDLAQLEQVYSKELSRTIMNNHDSHLFLRTKDTETAKYFEALAGNTTIRYKTSGTSNSGGMFSAKSSASRSTNETLIKKPLVSQDELLKMPAEKCIVFMTGNVLMLDKAYQSLLYREFLTKETVQNGRKKFVYCYPENREKFIQHFNLKPLMVELSEKPVKNPVPIPVPVTSDGQNGQISVTATQTHKEDKDKAINDLISNFIETIEKKEKIKSPIKIQEVIENEKELNINEQEVIQDKQENNTEFESDPEELDLLRAISQVKPKIEKSEKLLMEIQQEKEMLSFLDVSEISEEDELPTYITENSDINYEDEMPF
ncbi:VirD4-like conjugal transfer protein, CD1115 family [Bacillus sp. 1P06AnD]|uniref:VirD4-like conjugal transfer protein, CD1115 family n=1 Tax=Bacillus sp. 1P06AnD TaxID=3132208 RepID=UPI0039A32B32